MKIVVEKNIPFIHGVLEPYAEVEYLAPDDITAEAVRDADALIIRTRTRCDASLLDGSRCSMIASTTIGLDHIDLDYCHSHGIEVANAPGCNAPAVAQYVLASILTAFGDDDLQDMTLGIVGVGHVGKIVENWARQLGFNVLLNDPPRAEAEGSAAFVGLDEIARRSDIITFHTPYAKIGTHPTHHLADAEFMRRLERKPMVINSARGPIVDNVALLDAILSGQVGCAAIDCWEGEPEINFDLLDEAMIATPHIAGYSREGKIRATQMAVASVAGHFGFPAPHLPERVSPDPAKTVTAESIRSSYDPLADTGLLRANPSAFESLRNNYALRAEVV